MQPPRLTTGHRPRRPPWTAIVRAPTCSSSQPVTGAAARHVLVTNWSPSGACISGRPGPAREQLRAALDTFERLDARPWAERARAELAASGETVRRRDPITIDELTPQELQISVLLAVGKTTRETAAALFLSPKTIEYHLRHVYQKLDIHSRDELADALARPSVAGVSAWSARAPYTLRSLGWSDGRRRAKMKILIGSSRCISAASPIRPRNGC